VHAACQLVRSIFRYVLCVWLCIRPDLYNEQQVLNYFNYFTEIEDHFQHKRGAQIFLSPVDWALIESWKEAGIPLAAVLDGIDRAFEKFDTGRRRDTSRPRALIYCAAAVLEAAEAMREASVGGREPEKPAAVVDSQFAPESLAGFIAHCADELGTAKLPAHAEVVAAEVQDKLQTEAENIRGRAAGSRWTEDVERTLTALEDKLFAAIEAASSAELMVEIRRELDTQLASYRRNLRSEQLLMLERQFLRKRLFEHYQLPRLSLFHMK
jgi:hypothetical protein